MPSYTPGPVGYQTILDGNGDPIAGGKVYTRLNGLATPVTTYSDAAGTPNANPIVADAYGRFTMFLTPGVTYSIDYADATGAIFRTVDGIPAVPGDANNEDVQGIAGEALAVADIAYLSDGSGGKTAGKWYKADADIQYASTLPMIGGVPFAIAVGASGIIRLGGRLTGFSGLTVGTKYYVSATAGGVTSTAPPYARFVGVADATDALILQPNPSVPIQTNVDVPATMGETMAAELLCYLSDGSGALTAGRWYKADADLAYACTSPIIGWNLALTGSGALGLVRIAGRVEQPIGPGFTAGAPYYVSATAGLATATAPARRRLFAQADSTTSLILAANPPPQLDAEYDAGNVGAAITINFATNGPVQKATRNNNTTITLVFPSYAGFFFLRLVHEASGTAYTVAFSPTPLYPGGLAPTFTNTSGAIDTVSFYWNGTTAYAVVNTAWA